MHGIRRWSIALAVLLCWMTLGSMHGIDIGEKVKLRGLIVGRTGETLTVKTAHANVTVVLTDDTKAQKPKGLGLRKTQMSFTALIPGLKVSVDGVGDAQNRVVDKTITFSGDDLRTAETIQAGLFPTQQAVGINQQNIEVNKQNIAANKLGIAANRERIGANEEQIAASQQEIQDVSKRFSDLTEFDTQGRGNCVLPYRQQNNFRQGQGCPDRSGSHCGEPNRLSR